LESLHTGPPQPCYATAKGAQDFWYSRPCHVQGVLSGGVEAMGGEEEQAN